MTQATPDEAALRKTVSAATIGLMRDAMLRPSEVSNVRWLDLQQEADDSGRLTGNDSVVQISSKTLDALDTISKLDPRTGAAPDDTVLPADWDPPWRERFT